MVAPGAGRALAALVRGLGASAGTALRRRLLHPGAPARGEPLPDDAPRDAHLAAAFAELVSATGSRASIQCGRPARTVARAWIVDGELVLDLERGVGHVTRDMHG
jgi:hypothetical protein